ncbi:hypothetical protein, partial [Shewanella algae]|uniref:hypothetical protein n=1 Tax=Shewanella algae TaxID=38313 RepID=UPI001CA3921E
GCRFVVVGVEVVMCSGSVAGGGSGCGLFNRRELGGWWVLIGVVQKVIDGAGVAKVPNEV